MSNFPKRFSKEYESNPNFVYPEYLPEGLKEQYQKYTFALEQYNDLVNYLSSTSKEPDKGYGSNEYGLQKDLDADAIKLLGEKVANLVQTGQNLAAQAKNTDIGEKKDEFLFGIHKNLKTCMGELNALESLKEGENLSYPALHSRSTDVIIDVGSDELSKKSGQVSSRFQIRYMDETGKIQSGFFTEGYVKYFSHILKVRSVYVEPRLYF